MKRHVLFLIFLSTLYTFSEFHADAQQLWKSRRIEAAIGLGPSFFFGDIGGFSKSENALGFKDLTFLQTRYNVNFSARYRILQDLNVRLSLTSGKLKANDSRGSNEGRAMTSTISIFEPAFIAEFYFIKNKAERSYLFTQGRNARFSSVIKSMDFYAFSGIGGLNYSVEGNENLIEKGLVASGFSAVIPVGVGTAMIFTPDFNLGLEIGGRYSFTDNLDGYTSQYSSSNDVYYFLNFCFTYKLRTKSSGLPSFRRR